MQYRPEIDGLRAVAVLPVILFHADFIAFSGGYVGVDVFFVISGYLITGILLSDLEKEDFSIVRFYERRARRILPALFFVMLVCLPFAYTWMPPSQLKDFAQSLIATVFFSSNLLFWREEDYFAAAAELKPLLHTWSLAVEEQYYILFPGFLALMWRLGRPCLLWSMVAVATLSFLLAEWGWRNSPIANFYLAPTRAWELFAGSICALVTVKGGEKSSNILSTLGLTLIVLSIFAYNHSIPFPSVYTLIPVIGTVLVILFAKEDTWAARLLGCRSLVGIGLISYSAYLWHQPLFAFARLRSPTEPSQALMATLTAVTLLMAWFTWNWIEQPFRRRLNPVFSKQRGLFVASGTVGAAFVSIGLAVHLGDGFSWRLNDEQKKIASYAQYPRERFYREGTCFLRMEQRFEAFTEACSGNTDAMIIGDSHAAALASFLSGALRFSQYTASGCPPALEFNSNGYPNCRAINDFIINEIMLVMPTNVVLHANWSSYWQEPGFQDALRHTIKRLIAADVRVAIVGGVPHFSPSIVEQALLQHLELVDGRSLRTDLKKLQEVNFEVQRLAEELDVLYWDPISELCPNGTACVAVVASQPRDISFDDVALIAWDYGHLTLSGAYLVGGRLINSIMAENGGMEN